MNSDPHLRDTPTLVLGAMLKTATPTSHWASGPWCFAGQEDLFPKWETTFTFAPEPLKGNTKLAKTAVKQAQALCVDSLPALAATICSHSTSLPLSYWEVLLAPWAIVIAQQIVERQLRVKAMIDAWGHLPLKVPLLPFDCNFDFAREQDVVLYGALGAVFNHWLFSRLLEAQWPQAWQKEYLPRLSLTFCQKQSKELSLRHKIKKLQLYLPFPKLKGMGILQALRFSLALLHASRASDDSYPLHKIYGSAATDTVFDLPPANTLPLFLATLPHSIRDLRHPSRIDRARHPRVRTASIHAYEDSAYRQRLALWRGQGNHLVWVQHGGNYGQTQLACASALVEYSQHAFVTWGWTKHDDSPGNFIPLPHPQLVRIKGLYFKEHSHKKNMLLFVGTEITSVGYRLDSHPTPLQMISYRKDKEKFFANLPSSIHESSFYRPYFDVPGSLQDASWLLPRFPLIRLCHGALFPQMLSSRLLVLDHHGTTLLEALAAGIPCICYWQRSAWPLTVQAEALVDTLGKAGIWYPTPQEAAEAVKHIWADVETWWTTPVRQEAREAFCDTYALATADSQSSSWLKTLKRL